MKKLPLKYTYKGPLDPEHRKKSSKGGKATSEKKARAARDNGLLGGRPKKQRFEMLAGRAPVGKRLPPGFVHPGAGD